MEIGADERLTVTSTRPAAGPPVIDQRRRLVIIGALLLGMLLAALDQTIVATALPAGKDSPGSSAAGRLNSTPSSPASCSN
jgi:hypothetical protein